jgi:hypothetical protein
MGVFFVVPVCRCCLEAWRAASCHLPDVNKPEKKFHEKG